MYYYDDYDDYDCGYIEEYPLTITKRLKQEYVTPDRHSYHNGVVICHECGAVVPKDMATDMTTATYAQCLECFTVARVNTDERIQ